MDQQKHHTKDNKNEVREGQENSSILHDKKDPQRELINVTEKDISSTNQEEFINDDENTKKREQ